MKLLSKVEGDPRQTRARKALNNWGVPHQAGIGIIEVRRQDLSDAQAALDSVRVGYRR